MAERAYPWLALRFEYTPTGQLTVRWQDDRTRRWSPPAPPSPWNRRLVMPPWLDVIASSIDVPYPWELDRVSDLSGVVAVFLDAPVALRGLPLERLAEVVLEPWVQLSRVQFIRWARRRPTEPHPFQLPLRVLAVGPQWSQLEEHFRGESWLAGDADIAEYGFRLEVAAMGDLRRRLAGDQPAVDLLVVSDIDLQAALLVATQQAPRVIAAFGHEPSSPGWLSSLRVPSGCSVALFAAAADEFTRARNLIYEFIHDQPLHAAVRAAVDNSTSTHLTPDDVRVLSDPTANQALRLSDAVEPIVSDIERLTFAVDPTGFDRFVKRLEPDEAWLFSDQLTVLRDVGEPLRFASGIVEELAVTFTGESTGLVPLARARAAQVQAQAAEPRMLEALSQIVADPRSVEILRRKQHRAVDIALLRLEASPLSASPGESPPAPSVVERGVVLRGGATYRLRVHVGTPSAGSLLIDPAPTIDPLLPDPPDERGHELEVLVHGLDFNVLGPGRATVYLPLLGGTTPMFFDVRAPDAPEAQHAPLPVRARIAVHYRGNLVQSFLLSALVAEEEEAYGEPRSLQVKLEFAQSHRLANLDDIGPRDFTIGVNDAGGGTHHLTFRSADAKADVPLSHAHIEQATRQFRSTLLEATFSDPTPNPPVQRFELGASPNWDEFDHYVRLLARDGWELYKRLVVSSMAMRPALKEIGVRHDELIQIVLYNSAFSFPWAGMYDRRPPGAEGEVCLGGCTREELKNGAPLEFRCGHDHASDVFCVFGFWGLRHRLEYLLPGAGPPIPEVPPLPAAGSICLALGDVDPHTQPLVDRLVDEFGPRVQVLTNEDPLEVLWGSERPAEMVLLGHLDAATAPHDPQITFFGSNPPLRLDDIMGRVVVDLWDRPNSLVLLMACGSAATDLGSLVTLLEAFAAAPAGAVVGTETPVVESLVSLFAAELTSAMWRDDDRLRLGAAMTDVRRRLIARGNPLGFGFSAYGNADLGIGV